MRRAISHGDLAEVAAAFARTAVRTRRSAPTRWSCAARTSTFSTSSSSRPTTGATTGTGTVARRAAVAGRGGGGRASRGGEDFPVIYRFSEWVTVAPGRRKALWIVESKTQLAEPMTTPGLVRTPRSRSRHGTPCGRRTATCAGSSKTVAAA